MNQYITYFLVLNISWCSADLITKFKLCSRSDPNLNDCLKSAIGNALSLLKNGVPDINIPPLEPLKLEKYTVKGLAPVNFDHVYTNIELHDHVSSEIKEVSAIMDDTKFSLTLKVFNPEVKFVANYDYKNAVIGGMDMSSKGNGSYVAIGFQSTVKFNGEIRKSDDIEHIYITDCKVMDINVDDMKINYEAENAAIGKTLTKFFNDNWKEVVTKEKKMYAGIYAEAYKKEANSIFGSIPYNKLFPK